MLCTFRHSKPETEQGPMCFKASYVATSCFLLGQMTQLHFSLPLILWKDFRGDSAIALVSAECTFTFALI